MVIGLLLGEGLWFFLNFCRKFYRKHICPKSCKIQLPCTFQVDILVNLNKITALSYPKKKSDFYFWPGEKHIAKKGK